MYEIKFATTKLEKKYKKLLKSGRVSQKMKETMRDILENNPYPSNTQGEVLCKVEKKGDAFGYEITGGDRVLFLIYKEPKKYVQIIFVGNDNEEIRFLKSLKIRK